jgi:hypothetical protein
MMCPYCGQDADVYTRRILTMTDELKDLREACESYLRGDDGDLDTAEFMEIVFPKPKVPP